MNTADAYRVKAAELEASSRAASDPAKRIEWQNLARAYRRLAEQADLNARSYLVYEPQPSNNRER